MDRLTYHEGETITYQRRGGSWLAVSGYRDGEIFYRKSNLACRGTRWHTIELQYPRYAKERLDRIVTEIARRMEATAQTASEKLQRLLDGARSSTATTFNEPAGSEVTLATTTWRELRITPLGL